MREELKRVKEQSRALKDKFKAEKEAKKQRRIENLKRAQENAKKNEIVQVVSINNIDDFFYVKKNFFRHKIVR